MLTEEKLLKLGNAKSLDEIQTLNLSSQHLTDEILANAEKFFIEMSSLDELDLSGNQIRFMPELEMAEVRSLNLSHNNLQNVDFIEHLWTVEELDLRGNSVIDITEKMKVRVFLPRLEILDGEQIPEIDAFTSIKKQLEKRIGTLYIDSYKDKLIQLKSNGENYPTYDAELAKFVEKSQKLPAGPSSVRRFRTWFAERIALAMVEDDETADYEIDDKLQYYAQLKKNRGMSGTNSRKFPKSKFYPTAALQCHAENVKSEDVQVWAIAFEPDVVRNGETTSLFGSCGGDSVCFTDGKTGKVKSKFVDPDEEFFCCAWSSFSISQRDTILAVGGKKGIVYILSPNNGACSHQIRPARTATAVINCMQFVFPKRPELLFIGITQNTNNTISGWTVLPNKQVCQKIIELNGLDSPSIRLLIPNKSEAKYLFAASESCIKAWNIENCGSVPQEKRNPLLKLAHPNLPENGTVDALMQLNEETIASKITGSGIIFTWSLESIISQIENGKETIIIIEPVKLLNWSDTEEMYLNMDTVISKGILIAGDANGQIWMYTPCMSDESPDFQDASGVIQWPKVNRQSSGLVTLQSTIINDISITSNGSIIAAATNNNIVLILKQNN